MCKWGTKIDGGWFDEQTHCYRNQEGVIVPSVTQVFDILGLTDFSRVKPETLEWKRVYGTAVHSAIEFLMDGDLDWDKVDDAIFEAVVSIEQRFKDMKFVSHGAEIRRIVTVYGMQYGMTLDHKGKMLYQGKERWVIIDLKTADKEEPTWKWQLGAYSLGEDKVQGGWLGMILKSDAEKTVPFYYDLLSAQKEFMALLPAAILKLNAGLYKFANMQ